MDLHRANSPVCDGLFDHAQKGHCSLRGRFGFRPIFLHLDSIIIVQPVPAMAPMKPVASAMAKSANDEALATKCELD